MIVERCVYFVRSSPDPKGALQLLRSTTSAELFREILRALKTEAMKEP